MKHGEDGDTTEYFSGDMRNAHLKLAQRHNKIIAGQFFGRRKVEPEVASPGVVGQLAVSFTPSATLPKESRITCVFPDHGWRFPTTGINAVLRLPQGLPTSSLKAIYTIATRTLEVTFLTDAIPAETPVVIFISGVATPEAATPAAEVTVTSYEKLVVRNTSPVSTRGGQILDGPTIFTIPAIVPGNLRGTKRWQPFSCCPCAVSDVTLSFETHGCLPAGSKILVELPADGWEMEDAPRVLLRTKEYHNNPLFAHWRREQHTLEIQLDKHPLVQYSPVILTVGNVKNPPKETMNLNDNSINTTARVTSVVKNGCVVDGPTRIDVARISELRDKDFEVAKQSFDEMCAAGGHSFVPFNKLPDVLRRTGIVLSEELYQSLITANLPVRILEPIIAVDTGNEPVSEVIPVPQANEITREEFLNLFAQVYAPAYKFGQDLRMACGRGEIDRIRELISRRCDANAKDGTGWAALHYAADYGRLTSVDCLIESMNEIQNHSSSLAVALDLNIRDLHGWTPLLCAAANGHTEVVEKFLSLGGDLSIPSNEGRTALHWAALRGMEKTCEALLAAGAEIDRTDRSGWTALHCASLHGSDTCVTFLIAHGANPEARDKLHYPPAKYSASC